MSLKDISYLELWQPFCSAERNHCAILVEGIMEKLCKNYFEFGPEVQQGMSF